MHSSFFGTVVAAAHSLSPSDSARMLCLLGIAVMSKALLRSVTCCASGLTRVRLSVQCLRYLTPKMMQTAALHNIQLKQIDYTRSLIPQGPFDVIVHKLRPNPGTIHCKDCAWPEPPTKQQQ